MTAGGDTAREVHAVMRDELATMTDDELLAAIRRGDVSPARARVAPSADYYHRDDVLRDEAKRRAIL